MQEREVWRIHDAENRLTTVSGATSATFVYVGAGTRVNFVLNSVTTCDIGNPFTWTGSTSTLSNRQPARDDEVPEAQGQGMRVNDGASSTLDFLRGDHMGSTSVLAPNKHKKITSLRPGECPRR
ncbi:MAG TPA: hypothetical protein PLJ78_08215 [Anaerolineae bacterium]|nr:hypothetical protein [Anaerolineae bacterium]HQK13909.1 hypothetical protein [Anaerolineae bacterium]